LLGTAEPGGTDSSCSTRPDYPDSFGLDIGFGWRNELTSRSRPTLDGGLFRVRNGFAA